ncbi:MAG: lipoate--protein ligase family protein [Candidatus Bathyarchaeota archaeon]|nr:lipoate--protein ligase family protein [Candidatus Bathyarchaeota archaeon]
MHHSAITIFLDFSKEKLLTISGIIEKLNVMVHMWRLVDLKTVDGFTSASIFEAVGFFCSRGRVPNTILFWRVNPPCVYVGYHQNVLDEVNVDECKSRGVNIVRRTLGGGSVYCDLNQFLYSITVNVKHSDVPFSMQKAYKVLLKGVVLACKKLGLSNTFYDEKLNAIISNGKKISGNAGLQNGNIIMVNGDLLLDFDYGAMCKVLKDPLKNLPGKPKNPEDGLTSIKKELKRYVDYEEVKKILQACFEETLNIKLFEDKLKTEEFDLALKLKEKYQSKTWLYKFDLKRGKIDKNLLLGG